MRDKIEINIVDNVWASQADSKEEAESLKVKAQLIVSIREQIIVNGWDAEKIAGILAIAPREVSCLISGQISEFSLNKLKELMNICHSHL